MKRKRPLGDNPLDPETVLREMVRGGRARPQPDEEEPSPAIRKTPSTTTPGGLLRKTVYFTETEWRASKTEEDHEDRPYTDIIQEAGTAPLHPPKANGERARPARCVAVPSRGVVCRAARPCL